MAQATATARDVERPIGFLGLMRNRNYALLWWGQLVSEMGNRFHWIAVSLWVYASTGSAAAVSIAVSSMFVGSLIVGLWAGAVADRLNRRAILIVSDLTRALLVSLIPSLMGMNIWYVYADLALISVATAFFRPAIFAIVPQVVSKRDLLPANSFFSAMDTGTEIAGPAIAGVLAFRYGYALLLYADAVTYLVSALCLMGMSVGPAMVSAVARLTGRSVWGDIVAGLRYIRQDKLQWGLFLLIFPGYLVGSGLNALQTPLAKGVVGITDAEFGTLNSIWGVGFITSSLVLGWYGARLRKSAIILGGFFLAFAATALMGLSRSLEALFATAFGVGFANTLYYVGLSTALMEHTPGEIMGRVVSTRQAALGSVRIVAPILFGSLADIAGIRQSILTMVLIGVVGTALVAAWNSELRLLNGAEAKAAASEHMIGIWGRLTWPAAMDWDTVQQRRLNIAALGFVLLGWLGLLYRSPGVAAGLFGAMTIIAYLGFLLRRSKWLS